MARRINIPFIHECLREASFPASKEELIGEARKECNFQRIISTLKKIPDKEYKSPTDITGEIIKFT